MALLQRMAVCTVHDGHGGHCGREDQCTRVVTEGVDGTIFNDHLVCSRCRKVMQLPEWDVTISPTGEVRRFDG